MLQRVGPGRRTIATTQYLLQAFGLPRTVSPKSLPVACRRASTSPQAAARPREHNGTQPNVHIGKAPPVVARVPGPAPLTVPHIVLRPYQQDAIESCISALQEGLTRIGVSSPTGSGKTTMFMNLIPRIVTSHQTDMVKQGAAVDKGRTLILVSSVELANQAEAAAKRLLGPDWTVEVEQAKRTASGVANVTVATYQTLAYNERILKFDPARYKLVIVDEAHHAAAPSYLRILQYFHDGVQLPSAALPISQEKHGHQVPIIGFSATFSRTDALALSTVFEKIVFHREVSSMLQEGWLAPAKSTSVLADLHLGDVDLNNGGDYNTASLARHVNTPIVNDLVLRTYLHRAEGRRSTLVFCVDLKHVDTLTQAFRQAGIDARSISSLTLPLVRKSTIKAFGDGEFPVLVNCEVLTEGTDIPVIDCILLARPTTSKNLLAQMIGRGLRLSPDTGKTDCYIIDIVDSMSKGMVVAPTLLGLDVEDMYSDRVEAAEVAEGGKDVASSSASGTLSDKYRVTYIDQDNPFDVGEHMKRSLPQMSANAWVICGLNKYVLDFMKSAGCIIIEPDPQGIAEYAIFHRRLASAFWRPREKLYKERTTVGHADGLERAISLAERYAERKLGRDFYLQLSRYAPWRSRPASTKQLQIMLQMKGISLPEGDGSAASRLPDEILILGKKVNVRAMTAGQVASYVSAAKNGAFTHRAKGDRKAATEEKKRQGLEAKARSLAERNLPLPQTS